MRRTLFLVSFLLLLTPSVQAQEFNLPEKNDPANAMDEFRDVPEGLLMPPKKVEGEKGTEGEAVDPATAIAQGITAPLGTTGERLMTMEEINKGYKAGNYEKILPQIELLVRNGQHAAEELLGIMYKYGHGVTKDPKKSFDLMYKAAEANRPLSQHHLGVMYFTGEGLTEPDLVRSLMWLHIAIAHYQDGPEKTRALKDRDSVLMRLSRRDKERALEMARDWLEKKGEDHLLDMK